MRNATDHSQGILRVLDESDRCAEEAADDRAALTGESAAAGYQRAVQALRDVRHMLPPDGVAIVDAVLDGASFGHDKRADVGASRIVPQALAHQDELLNPEQENEFLEEALLN